MARQNIEGHIYETTGDQDEGAIEQQLKRWLPELVVACGGDGTLNMVARQLLGTDIQMGILPLGSANGLARDLCIPDNVAQALDVLRSGKLLQLDVLLINNKHHCLHLSDMGYNARLIQEFESDAHRGKWGYIKSFFKVVRERPLAKFRVQSGNRTFKRRSVMATFANARRYGTGAIVNPQGQLNDGQFETCLFLPWPRWYLLWMSLLFFIGQIERSRYVKIWPGKRVRVESDRPLPLQVDGELIGECDAVEVEILPEKVQVLVPKR
jgi:diacylglycerol kinase family enzyme